MMMPFLPLLLLLLFPAQSTAQQSYVDNKQLRCDQNDTVTLGFLCNGASSSCPSFLTFRSTPTYNTPVTIAYLLSADASQIAAANNISDVDLLPDDTLVIVPVTCSCFNRTYYQHNASYVLKHAGETYFSVANNTYQSLSTCQSMIAQNPYNYRQIYSGMRLNVPLRCACPTPTQVASGFNYLLTYLIRHGDSYNSIAAAFSGPGAESGSIQAANNLTATDIIFYFTPILVPLRSQPTAENINTNTVAAPPLPPPPPAAPIGGSTSHRWPIFVGIGIGSAALLLLFSLLIWFFRNRHRHHKKPSPPPQEQVSKEAPLLPPQPPLSSFSSSLASSIETLSIYKFDELEKATGSFAESNRINGSSVYRALINGDDAVVKITKGDVVSREIGALRKINHSRIVRLSGYCLHQGITYLVYEYAENGSLAEWLRGPTTTKYNNITARRLDWKQRLQVVFDVADALNYLHNFADPPYIHKNLKSSNVILDGNMRAKVANFGLSRALDDEDDQMMMMTRHVVGTHGYMAPEYVESGLITPKLDVFALGVVMLEVLSGQEPVTGEKGSDQLLSRSVEGVLDGDNVREKLRGFMDPWLQEVYPLEMAHTMVEVAKWCVAQDLNARPTVSEVFMALSKLVSSSLDWDPSHEETSFCLSE